MAFSFKTSLSEQFKKACAKNMAIFTGACFASYAAIQGFSDIGNFSDHNKLLPSIALTVITAATIYGVGKATRFMAENAVGPYESVKYKDAGSVYFLLRWPLVAFAAFHAMSFGIDQIDAFYAVEQEERAAIVEQMSAQHMLETQPIRSVRYIYDIL